MIAINLPNYLCLKQMTLIECSIDMRLDIEMMSRRPPITVRRSSNEWLTAHHLISKRSRHLVIHQILTVYTLEVACRAIGDHSSSQVHECRVV